MKTIEVFKGTDKDMKCRGMQYEIGKTKKTDGAIRCGGKGFHSCEAPFDVLKYYPMRDGNRYFTAEAGGKIDRTNADDSKIASSELTLKAEVSFLDLVKAQISYTRKKALEGTAGGDGSNLAGGYKSNLAGGDGSNLACGNGSNLAGGEQSLIVGDHGSTAKGGKGSVIVLVERNGDYEIINFKAVQVDGLTIKENTYYTLKNGEFEEVK